MPNSAPEKSNVIPLKATPCPVCKKPEAHAYRPFCSKRCADLDLGKWLSEGYAIAAQDDDDMVSDAEE